MNGTATGPYNAAQLQAAISGGQVTGATLVWTTGMAVWAPAQTVPLLQQFFAAPPPLPPSAPPAAPPAPPA